MLPSNSSPVLADNSQACAAVPRKTPKGLQTRFWGLLRANSERIAGRSRLWSWLWDREFESLIRDQDRENGR